MITSKTGSPLRFILVFLSLLVSTCLSENITSWNPPSTPFKSLFEINSLKQPWMLAKIWIPLRLMESTASTSFLFASSSTTMMSGLWFLTHSCKINYWSLIEGTIMRRESPMHSWGILSSPAISLEVSMIINWFDLDFSLEYSLANVVLPNPGGANIRML